MKKIAIIGTAGVPGRYGGFETLSEHLVLNLNEHYELYVYNSKTVYPADERPKYWNKARIFYLSLNANGVQSMLYDAVSLLHAAFYADMILLLGVSGGWMLPIIRLFTKARIVVNVDGLEWKRAKWNPLTRRLLKFLESMAIRHSDANIADNFHIKTYTKKAYGTQSHLIAYGGDHVSKVEMTAQMKQRFPLVEKSYSFAVMRIEPENNVHLILEAFSQLPNKNLLIVGNWDKSEYGRTLVEQFSKYANITLSPPIYDGTALNMLRSNCSIYVHGHSAGGTNPSLVEAMSLGLPIVAFDVNFNRSSTFDHALYFSSSDELKTLLTACDDATLEKIAQTMSELAKQHYRWKEIAWHYAAILESSQDGYNKKRADQSFSALNQESMIG